MSTSQQSNDDVNKEESDDVIILSDYPFYINGPDPKQIAKVAEKVKSIMEDACGEQLRSINRMGSSAIDGIAGTPVCDMLAEVSPWPLSNEAKEKLAKVGYEFKGIAPHDKQDEWYWGGDGKPGHLGRVVLHTVPEGSEFVRDMKAFVAYVNTYADAFQRYNTVKVEGARLMLDRKEEEGRLIGYKMKKAEVCNDIKKEAIEWWKGTHDDK